MTSNSTTRRRVLRALGLGALGASPLAAALTRTPSQTEGPFYPDPSDRLADVDADLVRVAAETREAGGEVLHLEGVVRSLDGESQVGALVEIWQCDLNGRYRHHRDWSRDRERDRFFQGYGQARTDESGRYRFRTIRPVPYPGRTPHIHVKVRQPDGRAALTTQMYVAGDPRNERDGIYTRLSPAEQRAVSVALERREDGDLAARFDLVV